MSTMPTTTSHKQSFSVPTTPAYSNNGTTSPAATRSFKADRSSAPPVTPQRLSRGNRNQFCSPLTPVSTFSTPYTPLSLRSSSSSNGSTLNTPGSALSIKRISFSLSPEVNTKNRDRSLADIADNWRSRANQNGIKVSSVSDDPHYADDEASDRALSEANSSEFITMEEALLPPPVLSLHRRVRAQSQANPPRVPLSPQVLRTPARRTLAVLNTPPPKTLTTQQLELKGSLTDPAHTRRRPSFGHSTMDLIDIDENEFMPYPQSFCSPARPIGLPLSFNDPFHSPALSTITEYEPHHFPGFNILPQPRPQLHDNYHDTVQASSQIDASSCSVCGRSSGALAILEPCGHPLCSACLTSALNIVGEKDMECAVCKLGVEDFHLQGPTGCSQSAATTSSAKTTNPVEVEMDMSGQSFLESLVSPTSSPQRSRKYLSTNEGSLGLLPSAFETERGDFFEGAMRASTPGPGWKAGKENAVLRVDNVPWDITPPVITSWLKQPVTRVHVLLDGKGKTLSHAFVEVADEEVAKAVLRGAQNSVLGKGKRARGVTVTMSGQEELMRALFPSWRGNFDGSRPSLAALDSQRVISTLETGLMSEGELTSLLHLIRSPDSHFLKVSSLPFYSLVSILSKFPADVDSRVFWSGALRDMLYDITFTAVQILVSRITLNAGAGDLELLSPLVIAGMQCQAFTSQQMNKLSLLLDSASLPNTSVVCVNSSSTDTRTSDRGTHSVNSINQPILVHTVRVDGDSGAKVCQYQEFGLSKDPLGALAREFGVETQLVQALAQRLSGIF